MSKLITGMKAAEGVDPSRLDLVRMLQEIDDIVGSDWAEEMQSHTLHDEKPFTHAESVEMMKALGRIYSIAHCLRCKSCQRRYIKPEEGR